MSRTATAVEPNEEYDQLSIGERDVFDRIAAAGFRPERSGIGWAAEPTADGFERIGPCPTLELLEAELPVSVVDGEVVEDDDGDAGGGTPAVPADDDEQAGSLRSDGEDDVTELREDHRGNTYIPGIGPVVDEQLAAAAGKYHASNVEWKEAGKRRTDAKSELVTVAHLKENLFSPDPDNSDSKIYRAGGILIRIRNEHKEVVETEIEEEVAG